MRNSCRRSTSPTLRSWNTTPARGTRSVRTASAPSTGHCRARRFKISIASKRRRRRASRSCGPTGNLFDFVERAQPKGAVPLDDGDTVMSPKSWEAALRSAGRAPGRRCGDAGPGRERLLPRPAARPSRGSRSRPWASACSTTSPSPLCMRSASHGAERVAVVDFDVHHGNGTQAIFWDDTDFFYASTHQMPLFPGTGAHHRDGADTAISSMRPCAQAMAASSFARRSNQRILPPCGSFAPDLIVVSAGFDAHRDDPLANLHLVEEDYAWVTRKLMEVADGNAAVGGLVSMLEGGYDLTALSRSVARARSGIDWRHLRDRSCKTTQSRMTARPSRREAPSGHQGHDLRAGAEGTRTDRDAA